MKLETLQYMDNTGLTETEVTQAVELYETTGKILNRAVAIEMGLVEY